MKEKFIATIAIIALILSVLAIILEVSYQISEIEPSKIKGVAWTSKNDGLTSGLDADRIDNLESDQFLRNDQSGVLDGDLEVNGSISYQPITKYYTLSAFDFVPKRQDYSSEYYLPGGGTGFGLRNTNEYFNDQMYFAPVHLPDDATINKLYAQYTKTNENAFLIINFQVDTVDTKSENFANHQLGSYDLPLKNFSFEPSFESDYINHTVDNNNQKYSIWLSLGPFDDRDDVIFYWITIEYTVTNL